MKKNLSLVILLILALNTRAQQSYSVTFLHDGKTVYGTFTTPNGICKFPTVIINPGTGANNRDGTIPLTDGNSACLFPSLYGDTLKIYKDLSEALVDSGYAVLTYDKLEYTYPQNLGAITFHKLWLPVESAINYVKTRDDVDTNKIILIGHSEGSALIPFIAKDRSDVKALISLAGARTPFDSLLARQLNNLVALLRPCGATANDSATAANQASQILSYFNVIRTNSWNGGTPALFGVPASAWYNYLQATDPVAANYNNAGLPAVFIGMGLDIQVPPSELTRFQNEITITNDFWSMPGLTHYMTPENNKHVSKALTDTIVHWLREQGMSFTCYQFAGIQEPSGTEAVVKVYPNPFSSVITFSVNKPKAQALRISIHNILGEEILFRENKNPGNFYSDTIDLSKEASGVYFLSVYTDDRRMVKKIIKE